jgi:hypothetical protein
MAPSVEKPHRPVKTKKRGRGKQLVRVSIFVFGCIGRTRLRGCGRDANYFFQRNARAAVIDSATNRVFAGHFFWIAPRRSLRLDCWSPQINLLMVRNSLALLSGFAILGAFSASADDVLPPRFNFDRYTRMVDHSPFAVATAVALPEAAPDFAKDLYVANAARSPEGDMVTIASSSDQNFKKYLNTKEAVDGYSIASIEWSEKVGETKVTINKDGKSATLTFNQVLLSQAAPQGLPAPAQVSTKLSLIPPSGTTQASRPHSRGMIQRSLKTVPTPAPMGGFTPLPEPKPKRDPLQAIDPQVIQGEQQQVVPGQ